MHSLELHRIKPWTPPIIVLYFQVPQTYGTKRLIVKAVTGLFIMSAIIQPMRRNVEHSNCFALNFVPNEVEPDVDVLRTTVMRTVMLAQLDT